MPEEDFGLYADAYLIALAPLYGMVASVAEPHGGYRLHGSGNFAGTPFEERVRRGVAMSERLWSVFGEHARRVGRQTDAAGWHAHSWWHRLARLLEDVPAVIDQDGPPADFVLIDDDVLGLTWACDRAQPFIERDGIYWGPPADDATAVAELRRMRQAGARYVVVIWPSFWWLEHYPALKAELDSAATPLLDDERVKVFGFDTGAPA